jgi:hypothetical protein
MKVAASAAPDRLNAGDRSRTSILRGRRLLRVKARIIVGEKKLPHSARERARAACFLNYRKVGPHLCAVKH